MTITDLAIHSSCIALALLLFLIVNWIGRHAVSFGYHSTTLFEDPNESVALNFLIRTLPPAVCMVLLSAGEVASDNADLRLQSYWVAIYYYVIRAAYFPIFGLHLLINWRRFAVHCAIGLRAAWAAFNFLILPQKSLLPDLETAGNELWLAMLIFVYAVGNNVVVADSDNWARRNSYVGHSFQSAEHNYGRIVDEKLSDDLLKLVTYAVIVYEGYCRPPVVRILERVSPWTPGRTTGIMQVSSDRPLPDEESVELGVEILRASWLAHQHQETWDKVRSVIADYNRDDSYVYKVLDVMEIIAKRIEPRFLAAHSNMWEQSTGAADRKDDDRLLRIKKARFSQSQSPRRLALRHKRKRSS